MRLTVPSLEVPSLKQFFLAHGAANGERRVVMPFHDRIFRYVTKWMLGKLPGGKLNLYIAVPPGHGKTYIARDTIAYGTGLFPDSQWLYTSYAAQLAVEQTNLLKGVMNSDWYRSIFPWVGTFDGTMERFRNSQGSITYGVGAGGALTGFRGGQKRRHFSGGLVLDDLLKADEARSEVARKHLWQWYTGTLLNRKNRDDTPMLMIAQRLHPEDLPGMIKTHFADQWYFLEIPGVDEENKTTIWPDTFSYDSAMRLKDIDEFAYYSQYQQMPIIPGGSLIKADWWQFYDESEAEIKRMSDSLIMTADTAHSAKDSSDYSVLQLWGFKSDRIFLIDQIRGKWPYEVLLDKVINFWTKHSYKGIYNDIPAVSRLFIEDKSSGLSLLGQKNVFKDAGIDASPWNAAHFVGDGDGRHDKVARVNIAKLPIFDKKVYLPNDGNLEWVADFIAECSSFNAEMTQSHDDQVDAMTMAVLLWMANFRWH